MRFLFVIAALLCSIHGFSQRKEDENDDKIRFSEEEKVQTVVEGDAAWTDGTILDNDGNELKGQIKYNDRTGIVSFESGKKSGSYNARNITGFDFYDAISGYQRYFFSLPAETDKGTINQFFELVRQYKKFAIIIRTDPIDVRRKRRYIDDLGQPTHTSAPIAVDLRAPQLLAPGMTTRTIVDQSTTLYILADDMTMHPFLEITDRDLTKIGRWSFLDGKKTKVKVLDDDLPKRIMGEHYKKVQEFAKARGAKWSHNEDVVTLFDYYDSLVK